MNKDDFKISGDTIVWMIVIMLVAGIVVSYHIGYDNGVQDEKIGWLEDREMQRITKEKVNE